MIVHPRNIVKIVAAGLDSMGTLADDHSSPRFYIDVPRYALSYARLVIQNGTGDADLTIYQRHRTRTGFHDFALFEYADIGATNREIDLRIQPHELMHYTFDRSDSGEMDALVPVWANPDTGIMRWAWEFGLIDVGAIDARAG